ncbi:RNA polymerase 2 transcription mediator complex subunit [Niveomyces insectorum RCEF 264]|uniref:Mediator of RNA polymerase II transcription subunit 6 n=1 Tax=Niveomyces insectorum RCEF 264 TaxID=1081102 RepID=A0A162JCJ6_9HYPO|nr:RNA polymerase 2 transcription mediator complex subunit [Niveomyces insectorum RCEF 264]
MSLKALDELQWSDPAAAEAMQGIHSNSVLFYFMLSPYFDKTSNNNTVYNQALHNASMFPVLETRERFEDFLRSMSGVEYVVHQAPAEMAPGTGTGVWVLRKQLRRKRNDGQPDDLTVYADYFVVGYNIYQAPALADVLSARITSMAVALSKAFPAMANLQTWSPARGHVYETADKKAGDDDLVEDEEEDEDEDEDEDDDEENGEDHEKNRGDAMAVDRPVQAAARSTPTAVTRYDTSARSTPFGTGDALDPRLAEESYAIHLSYGGEYMDEQVISGRPGEFHISFGGGGGKTTATAAQGSSMDTTGNASGKAPRDGSSAGGGGKDGKEGKDGSGGGGGKTGGGGKVGSGGTASAAPAKPKRRKSKVVPSAP